MGVKISELTTATSADSSDILPIVQNGETKQISKENFLKDIGSSSWTSPTLNSYITGNIRYAKIGNIVIVNLTDIQVSSALSHGVVLATGLPTSITYQMTILDNFDAPGTPMRIAVNSSGEIVDHYSTNGASTNNYYGTLIYITNEE